MGQIVTESHLIKRGEVYYTDIILGNGKRIRRSTGEKTQSLARVKLADIIAELEAAETQEVITFGVYANKASSSQTRKSSLTGSQTRFNVSTCNANAKNTWGSGSKLTSLSVMKKQRPIVSLSTTPSESREHGSVW
jgi:hypothetical protein